MAEPTDFDRWIRGRYREGGAFTLLIVLIELAGTRVTPVASSFAHVIGDEFDWRAMRRLLDGAHRRWHAVVFFAAALESGGPLDTESARRVLHETEQRIAADRLAIRSGHFFDLRGRRMQIDPAPDPPATLH